MDDPSPSPDDRRSAPAAPRWVKVFVIVAAVVVLLFVVLLLTGNNHGPGRHRPQEHGVQRP